MAASRGMGAARSHEVHFVAVLLVDSDRLGQLGVGHLVVILLVSKPCTHAFNTPLETLFDEQKCLLRRFSDIAKVAAS